MSILELSATEMAEACGLNYRAFQKLNVAPVRNEMRGKSKCDIYRLTDVIDAVVCSRSSRVMSNPNGETLDKEWEEAAYIRAKREAQELKNERMQGEQAPISILAHALSSIVGQASAALTSIPLNIKSKHPEVPTAVIRQVERELVAVQNTMSAIEVDWSDDE